MEIKTEHYVKHHLFIAVVLIGLAFVVLAAGEYRLLREQLKLNKMVSEGLMQVKEIQKNTSPVLTPFVPSPTNKINKMTPRQL